VFVARLKVIFIHGCFWHGHDCTHGRRRPTTNTAFWDAKMRGNRARDARRRRELEELGWRSLEIWECEVKSQRWLKRALRFLGKPAITR
jgi:DNA mismatch endonuclease (patch repair protein)